jgi:hypothetical protein
MGADKTAEEAQDDEVLDEHDFILPMMISTQDPEKRNMSSKSEIMDPFNTSISAGDDLRQIIEDEGYMFNDPNN